MTPARLAALLDVEDYMHEKAESAGTDKRPSSNPAADLAALANL